MGTGALRSRSDVSPVTLSGVEVTGVQLGGKSLVVHGVRMALVARADGAPGMERKRIHSVTNIVFSLRRGDKRKYVADEEIQLLLHPDKSGSYEATLHKVFLYGFAELAAAAPAYWQCYARSYWGSAVSEVGAEKAVEQCVDTSDDGTVRLQSGNDGRTSSPALLSPLQLQPLYRASDLGVQGEAVIHVHVRAARPWDCRSCARWAAVPMRPFCRCCRRRGSNRRGGTGWLSRPAWIFT